MIIRQGLNFAAHLLAGVVLGALAVSFVRSNRPARAEQPPEPRYTPPPESQSPAPT